MPESEPRRRWYHITPDRLIVGLLAVEGFLFLSEWFQWFAFNERKGYTVLIAVAAVCLVIVVMLVWLVVSLLFRWRFQFSLRSLVVLVVAVAVPLGWFGVKLRDAERQRKAVVAICKAGGQVAYDWQWSEFGFALPEWEPPAPAWLEQLVGGDFFSDLVHVGFPSPTKEVDEVVLEHVKGLTSLSRLELSNTQVTDAWLEELEGFKRLNYLFLFDTQPACETCSRPFSLRRRRLRTVFLVFSLLRSSQKQATRISMRGGRC